MTIISVYLPLISQSNPSSHHTEFWLQGELTLLTSQTFAIITDHWATWALLMAHCCVQIKIQRHQYSSLDNWCEISLHKHDWDHQLGAEIANYFFEDLMGKLLKLSAFWFKSKNWNDFKDIYLKWNQRWKTFELFSIAQFGVCVHGRLWGLGLNTFWIQYWILLSSDKKLHIFKEYSFSWSLFCAKADYNPLPASAITTIDRILW